MLARSQPWVALLAALSGVAGCATAPPAADHGVDEGAVLEIVNRLPGAERVWVRGREEGVVPGAGRLRVRWLTPGPAEVETTPLVDAGVGGEPTLRAQVELANGRRELLEIPGPEPTPAGLGSLLVHNRLAGTMLLSVDDRAAATLLEGDSARIRDLVAGSHTLRAREARSGLAIEESVTVAADAEVEWAAEAARGGLRFINQRAEGVTVEVDGLAVGRVEPGEHLDLDDLSAGPHLARIRGALSDRTEDLDVVVVSGQRSETRIGAARAEVEVINRTAERVILSLPPQGSGDGAGPRVEVELAVGERHLLTDREPGELVLAARGDPSGLPYREAMTVPAGQRLRWEILPVRASLRLENATARELWVRVDNNGRQESLRPGATRMLDGLPVEPIRLLVVDRDRSLVLRRTIDPGEDRTASWKIEAPTGSLAVRNRSKEAVVVYSDARRVGRVEAEQEVVLTGVPAGHRLLEAVGTDTGHVSRGQADVVEDAAISWVVEDPLASLVITNETGETLLTEGVLAIDEASIAPGGRALLRIPAGTLDLRVVGAQTSVARRTRITAGPGDVVEWRVQAALGRLLVTSSLPETMVVSVDGAEVGRVAAHGRLAVDGLAPGAHELQAEGMSSGRTITARRVILPDDETHWAVDHAPARILVFNQSAEALEATLDGRPIGRVEAGTRQGFGALPLGPHELVLTATGSGWRDSRRLTLLDGATETVRVEPPGAVLVLANRSGETQRVLIDGALVTEIGEGAVSEPLAIGAGRRRVVAEGAGTGVIRVWRVDVSASQTVHLEVPPSRARLVVLNRGDVPLAVRVEGREVGTVSPGESIILDELAVGAFDLEAVGVGGAVVYRERRELEPGATATWVLPALPASTP
jgi:hypothetical protein